MTAKTKRFILAYLLLVAVPLLGLLGILHAGRILQAPFSVDGVWHLQFDGTHQPESSCQVKLVSGPSMTIWQSGETFMLAMPGGLSTASPGSISATQLNANLQTADAGSECSDLTLTASLDPNSNPRTLSGSLFATTCSSCEPLRFTARREQSAQKAGP